MKLDKYNVRANKEGVDINYSPDANGTFYLAESVDLVIAVLTARNKGMEDGLRSLVERVDQVAPAIDNAFLLAAVHGSKYSGPTLEEPMSKAKELLAQDQK